MIVRVPSARLLPVTIGLMSALLAVKSVGLVRAAMPTMKPDGMVLATAQAAGPSQAAEPPPDSNPPPPPPQAEPPVSDSERAVLLELRQRRQELDAREAALNTRESVLAAAEQKLSGRVGELIALQKRLEALEAGRAEREEASWQGLVKVYETMKPRDAATIFNDLAQPVLLNVLDRMKDAKAAPVLAAMNPDKARDVTAELAQLRSQRNAPLDAAGPGSPKGPRPPG
jgi:flagellar motility protein MotE (MotC chaperone)